MPRRVALRTQFLFPLALQQTVTLSRPLFAADDCFPSLRFPSLGGPVVLRVADWWSYPTNRWQRTCLPASLPVCVYALSSQSPARNAHTYSHTQLQVIAVQTRAITKDWCICKPRSVEFYWKLLQQVTVLCQGAVPASCFVIFVFPYC